ncbi:MAG: hypothetical protein K8I30_09760 [Anaerolineae bacterium]|nr:hypothetical protein [Anaerolineae bacterium]
MKTVFLLLLSLLLVLVAGAQDVPTAETLTYDSVVMDDLSPEAFYDWWFLEASTGDIVVVTMTAQDTLEPLIGILDPGGTLVARSIDGTPGSAIELELIIPADGEYTIVATRVGNENGTSTGGYELQVRRANTPVERVNPYQEVTFRCQDYEVTNVATLQLAEDSANADYYRISVYGWDGFLPATRLNLTEPEVSDCSSDSQAVNGDTVTLPDVETMTFAQHSETAAQLSLTGAAQAGRVTLTIGSKNGAAGRYLAVIEGLHISPSDDVDAIRIGQGPLTASVPLLVYMISDKSTRLDPSMRLNADDAGIVCDDAGRRGCEDVPGVNGLTVFITDGAVDVEGGRFDAGARLTTTDLQTLELSSFSGNTEGGYMLVLLGELPG